MKKNKDFNSDLRKLRTRAEKKVSKSRKPDISKMSSDDIVSLMYELETHQIELEMQNEELWNAQAELMESRDYFFKFYDLAPVGYVTTNAKGIIQQVNLTLAEMLGVPRERLIKQPSILYVIKEDQDIYYKHFNRMLKTKKKHVCELRMIKKNGDPFWARYNSVFVQVSDSKEGLIRSVISDITETKQAEKALRRKTYDLGERVKELNCLYSLSNLVEKPDII